MTPEEQQFFAFAQKNPIHHIYNIQGVKTLEPYQSRICKAIVNHKRVAIASCHDLGKTFTMAHVVLWAGSSFPNCKIITTAPGFKQVRLLLWSEIRAGYERSKIPLGGKMLSTEWKITPEWFAVGYTSKPEAGEGIGQGSSSGFQGFHAPYIFIIFDEATGVHPSIWKQKEGLMTSDFVRFIAIGNPTSSTGDFAECFSDRRYHKINLSCFDSPNFPANGLRTKEDIRKELELLQSLSDQAFLSRLSSYKVVRGYLLTVQWAMEMVVKHGMDHPLVVSKVFGEIPSEDEHSLIPLGIVQQAQYRTYAPKVLDRVSIGVDVARKGSDKTVITKLHGLQVVEIQTLFKRETTEVTGAVVRMLQGLTTRDVQVVVDATGIGSGVVDQLKEHAVNRVIPTSTQIREVHFGSGADAHLPDSQVEAKEDIRKKFVNLKARMFVLLGEDLKSGGLCLPEEDVFQEELPTIRFKFDSKGRWMIESKDEYKRRTGRGSPDYADSLALANYGRYDDGIGHFTEEMTATGNTIIKRSGGELW